MYQNISFNKNLRETLIPAVLNSYSIVFFLNNKLLAVVILLTTFLNFYAGLSGLLAVILVILTANTLGFDKSQLKNGVYSFNALLTGIGMGTFFDPGLVFFTLLAFASLLTLILSVSLGGWLFKYGLPFLSIPFVITFWFIVLPSSYYENLGLTHRNIFWINEVYSKGGNTLLNIYQTIDSFKLNNMVDIYLRSLSSIFFQNNIITGALIAVALLISSRIFFSLSIIGFISAFFFAQFSGSEAASITYYNMGANYMMVAFAIGGFFVIPSKYSYLWSVLLIPLTSIILLFFIKLLGFIQLPVFSLPFSVITILFVYFLRLRASEKKLILTPTQHYSPETNLYVYSNNKDRYARFNYFPLHFPFWGEWKVTQGYNGEFTHKGEWGNALDFMIFDNENKTYKTTGLTPDNYYCFGKPVLAPGDGIVEEIYDNIEDNEIGSVNMVNNWGNSIIIRHLPGVYTQLSHLKKSSFKVTKGSFVKRGDVIALCGNSGRSPQPHLHFQVQAYPVLGCKTMNYPISYYNMDKEYRKELVQFTVPKQEEMVSGIEINRLLHDAFDINPNSTLTFKYKNAKGIELTEHWDSYTDAYNYKYLHCRETDSVAYFIYDHVMFYFTAFYGNRNSLLHHFYLSAYKVYLGKSEQIVNDIIPLNTLKNVKIKSWFNDFAAPFINFTKVNFSIWTNNTDSEIDPTLINLSSSIDMKSFRKSTEMSRSTISIGAKGITKFTFHDGKNKIEAICVE